jgi:F-type H+-transporting ATPase subunit gamma
MQLVAASKMRRAQEADKASAPYTDTASEVLTYLASQGVTDRHPLFERRAVKRRLVIVIASDKGLAGAYNSNVFKKYIAELRIDDTENVETETIAIGRKAAQFASRLKDTTIVGVYEDLADRPSGHEMRSILDTVVDKFTSGKIDAVDLVFTEFVSSITQNATIRRLLPAGFTVMDVSETVRDAEYEPTPEVVLDNVVYRLLGAQIFQAILDAKASEHSMRMVAMKNATDNASDLIDDLTLEMNKVRQGAITQELAEISGGVEAMNE